MFRAPKFRHHVAEDETAIDMVERAAAGLIERHGQDTIAERRHADHPHPAAGHAVLRRRRRDGASPWHETELGARPAQRRMRGVRARACRWPAPADRSGQGKTALIAVAQNAAGRSSTRRRSARKAQAVGARRRRRRRAGHAVGRIADPRHRMPHLRRVRRRHDARRRPAAQVVAGRVPARAASASPKARSPRCWPAATVRCPRCRTRCATESA